MKALVKASCAFFRHKVQADGDASGNDTKTRLNEDQTVSQQRGDGVKSALVTTINDSTLLRPS